MDNVLELIGLVGAEIIRQELTVGEPSDGVSRFLLDRLTGAQVAEICLKILADQQLSSNIDIKVPASLVEKGCLPDEVLTTERTVYWRNAPCSKAAIILANTNDDQGQSLKDVTSLSAKEIKGNVKIWVSIASKGLDLSNDHEKYWRQALKGLQSANDYSLEQFASYVFSTRQKIAQDSVPIINALGWALPSLGLPRDSGYFQTIPQERLGHAVQWQKLYEQAITKRGCLLLKETQTRKIIDEDELRAAFDKVKDQIPDDKHSVVEAFIKSEPGWNKEARALAELEWEQDNISTIFSGLRAKKLDLASLTLEFFEDEFPDVLTDEEISYIKSLKKRSVKESLEEDREFYNKHRQELEQNRSLKAKWDKFVYGQPIECTDFIEGLLTAVERLFDRSNNSSGKKTLTVKTQKSSRKKWLDLNADVGSYFCVRYKGIDSLTSPEVKWETNWLFKYDELLQNARKDQSYKKNNSSAKSATEISFYVELKSQDSSDSEVESTQIIWRCNPNAIGMELRDDLMRLSERGCFVRTQVSRELVSNKGRLQAISLRDVGTLMAVYDKDRGSLIGTYSSSNDLAKIFQTKLKEGLNDQRLTLEAYTSILEAWNRFKEDYKQALESFLGEAGLSSDKLLKQCDSYNNLLKSLLKYAPGDRNRVDLLTTILRIGCIHVDSSRPAAIIAPWHPLRLASISVKARQVAGLIKHLLNSDQVDFGDSRLFFNELKSELSHPYYPEVAVGYLGDTPYLLSISDTYNDYSLLERPVRDTLDQATNENPTVAISSLLKLTKRYLELLPHERTNLSLILYNCDSTRFPQELVRKLSSMNENYGEVRCQVNLRHQDKKKLNRLYQEMIESSDADPDAFIASEISQDFMAKLRVGIVSDNALDQKDKSADIIFLQDQISRQAKEVWLPYSQSTDSPDILDNVPPRWSRKRAASKDELKSTVYLASPRQPEVGRTYLNAVYSVVNSVDVNPDQLYLPARQIVFQDDVTKRMFDEVHRLAEWVVNYDDLLERRQLLNYGVKVIRYQRDRSDERNLLVSSSAPLDLLQVLIKRRLDALNLDLKNEELHKLAGMIIDDANKLSGDIVLRAAKRGKFASELMGVVLSKAILRSELGTEDPVGWYFLDDYASWLGQKEEQIADILAISAKVVSGKPVLKMVVAESKYIDVASLNNAKKVSQKQLRDTVVRMINAIFGSPGRLDRDLWLSRISDLLVDGMEFSVNSAFSVDRWREEIRSGQIPIDISGYSQIFVWGQSESLNKGEQIQIPKVDRCYQEVYNRDLLRSLVLAYYHKKSLTKIREQIGIDRPWEIMQESLPAARVSWVGRVNRQDVSENIEFSPSVTTASEIVEEPESREINTVTLDLDREVKSSVSDVNINSTTPAVKVDLAEALKERERLNDWLPKKEDIASNEDTNAERWLNETVSKLRHALMSYDLQAKVLGQRLTPNAAIIRLKGSDLLKVDDIERKRSQLLTTHSLRIISVVGLPGEIVVSIERPQRQQVSLFNVLSRRKLNRTSGVNLSLIVGVKEIDGELLYLNLGSGFEGLERHAPHTLIAGATGSGKSVLLRNLLLDICATNPKDLANIYLIDPKAGVDYFFIEDMPHLKEGIIVDQSHAIRVLDYLIEEMEQRYQMFRQQRVSNLLAYNERVPLENRLPFLWLVHDEFAEWMLVDNYREAVSSIVQRLGVKARAAGIYLIFAAQRPDTRVLPMQLRDNLGNRLILKVESVGTSEITLGQKGAENLLGKGHLAARLSGEPEIIYAQVPFLSDEDLELVVEAIRNSA